MLRGSFKLRDRSADIPVRFGSYSHLALLRTPGLTSPYATFPGTREEPDRAPARAPSFPLPPIVLGFFPYLHCLPPQFSPDDILPGPPCDRASPGRDI